MLAPEGRPVLETADMADLVGSSSPEQPARGSLTPARSSDSTDSLSSALYADAASHAGGRVIWTCL